MVGRFVTELVEGSRVDSVFVLRSRELRAARTGEAYLALELGDRSGTIRAVLFRPNRLACAVPSGSVVHVSGTVTTFRGVKRLSLDALAAAEHWSPEDLLPPGNRPQEELVAEFKGLIAAVGSQELRRLLRAVFGDKSFFQTFSRCPASQNGGHSYIGGLLEHTVSVTSACAAMADRYPGVDRDLLVVAALVHGVGVVDELAFEAGVSVTDRGRMLGPAVLGVLRISAAAAGLRIQEDVLSRLEHTVLATGGQKPEGAVTLEALLLARTDELDASAASYLASVAGAALVEERWTSTGRTSLYAPSAA